MAGNRTVSADGNTFRETFHRSNDHIRSANGFRVHFDLTDLTAAGATANGAAQFNRSNIPVEPVLHIVGVHIIIQYALRTLANSIVVSRRGFGFQFSQLRNQFFIMENIEHVSAVLAK